jgi:2-oxoglutarate ferredoxin oxidoreductase subunit gamma
LSKDRISSPILNQFDTAIILNQQSLNKFESTIKPGGVLIYDPHGIKNPPKRTDIKVYKVKAMEATYEMDNIKSYNMIVLGAYIKVKPVVTLEGILKGLKKSLPARHHHLLPMNEAALTKGMEIVE